jgi:hypothetical protein
VDRSISSGGSGPLAVKGACTEPSDDR